MKKFILSLIMAVVAVPAFAGSTVVLTNSTPNEGGYYSAVLTDNVTNDVMNFNTFCLEYGEHFNPGSTYHATIDDTIKNSGTNPATLDVVTQKLYTSYLNGSLDNSYGIGTSGTYSQLQAAFWAIESSDASKLTWNSGVFQNDLITVVRNFSTNTILSASLNSSLSLDVTGYEDVMVLNLWGNAACTSAMQSQLIKVTTSGGGDDNPVVPAPAAVLLSGFGTCLVGLVRRRSL